MATTLLSSRQKHYKWLGHIKMIMKILLSIVIVSSIVLAATYGIYGLISSKTPLQFETAGLTIATLLVAVFSIYQYRMMTESSEKELRAYIGLDDETFSYKPIRDKDGAKIEICLALKNYGKIPAQDVMCLYRVDLLPMVLDDDFDFADLETLKSTTTGFTIFPTGGHVLNCYSRDFNNYEVAEICREKYEADELENANKGRDVGKCLYAYGHVLYDDGFGVGRMTSFCFRLEWSKEKAGDIGEKPDIIYLYPKNNEAN